MIGCRRLSAAFSRRRQFEVTTRHHPGREGCVLKPKANHQESGLAGRLRTRSSFGQQGEESLVAISPSEPAKVLDIEVAQNETKPPARFTEATLLSAMEGAGKLVEDEELREAMREKGLGTPATRSAIIEGLIHDGYVHRQGRELIATAKGLALITLCAASVRPSCVPRK